MTEKKPGPIVVFLRELVIIAVGAVIASTLLRLFLLQVFEIPSRSMETTLGVGDRVAVLKVIPPKRGDIVVFSDSLEWLGNPDRVTYTWWESALVFAGLMPDSSKNHLIKRVIGTEGDRVVCCDAAGRVSVNGVELDETSYLYTSPDGDQVESATYPFDVVVPAGRIFVLGDYRSNSADSRCHLTEEALGVPAMGAFPSVNSVVGVAGATVYPFDRWRTFPRPDAFDVIPDPTEPAPDEPVVSGDVGNC
ncbi:MAG: signal peptidase I [Propioniciclava sp.]